MFRWIHKYYTTIIDKPSVLFPLNLWTQVNIRYFKFKFLKNIFIFISNADFLKIKYINVLYKDWLFENFFFKSINYILILVVVFFFI